MVSDNKNLGIDAAEYQRRLRRVRPAGREHGYDNMGLGLLGHIAGEVNGTSFSQAVKQHVLQPLNLPNTAMGVPDRQLEYLGACHSWNDQKEPVQCKHNFMREVFQGAGDISTTGADMARFMTALLDHTCLDGRCVLKPSTYAQFTDMNQNRVHAQAKGMGFIIYEKEFAGRFAMGHDGGQDGFSTIMTLFPDSGTGVFISLFSYPGIPLEFNLSTVLDFFGRGQLVDTYGPANVAVGAFAEKFIPLSTASPIAVDSTFQPLSLDGLSGTYLDTRAVGSALIDRILRVLGVLKVEVEGEEVTIAGQGPFRQTGSGMLTLDGENGEWYFTDKGENVFLQHSAGVAMSMFAKVPWHMNMRWVVLPLILPLLFLIPRLLISLIRQKNSSFRKLGNLALLAGVGVGLGLYLELEYFAANYYPDGATIYLIGWRMLFNIGWVAALITLALVVSRRQTLFGFGGASAALKSLLVIGFSVSALAVAILLPYWGLVANFTE